jgi:hypothetical protein
MRVERDTGIQHVLIKDGLDPQTQKRQVEQQIRAAEERNKLFLENAARKDMDGYLNPKIYAAIKAKPEISISQLPLNFDKATVSTGLKSALLSN